MACRGGFSKGNCLSDIEPCTFPTWRAFGPGASQLRGWEPPHPPFEALPRTALRIVEGQGMCWDNHMARLYLGAISLDWDVSWLREADILAWLSTAQRAVCRMQLFPKALSIRLEAIPEPFKSYRLLAVPHPLGDLRGDAQATLKGLKGAWDLKARNLARSRFADDVLLLWPDGTIAETAIAAVGLQVDDKLLLPPLEGRVASITEAMALPRWAESQRLEVQRRPIALEELPTGQLWCMNAVRGLWQAEVGQL